MGSLRSSHDHRPWHRHWWLWAVVVALLAGLWAYVRFTRDRAVAFANDEDHFKYGSTGGERDAGIPYWLWKALPELFPEFLPDGTRGYASLGFVFDPSRPSDKDLPVGVSKRNVQ